MLFTTEPPGLAGKTARLPEPSRIPSKGEIAVIRGHADAAALSVACHDPVLHEALAPSGGEARAVFEAIEQARVEAIGAKTHARRRRQSRRAHGAALRAEPLRRR